MSPYPIALAVVQVRSCSHGRGGSTNALITASGCSNVRNYNSAIAGVSYSYKSNFNSTIALVILSIRSCNSSSCFRYSSSCSSAIVGAIISLAIISRCSCVVNIKSKTFFVRNLQIFVISYIVRPCQCLGLFLHIKTGKLCRMHSYLLTPLFPNTDELLVSAPEQSENHQPPSHR